MSNRVRMLRWGLYALCALAPAAYVLASEGLPAKPRAVARFAPNRGGFGADYFPEVTLRTHEGKEVRLYDDLLKDKVVVINFMYARCEGICPGTTANLRRVQNRLGDAVGRDVFMYSFTLKPEEDTPDVLRTYAAAHGVKPGWLFLTGSAGDLDLVRRKLGFVDPDPEIDGSASSHIGVVLYGNVAHQQWAACPCLTNPDVMLEQILWMLPQEKRPGIGVAPRAPAEVSQLPPVHP
ncbi:SCO family protein [Sorangium sp. So ce128]|uniref:SCO family protein n=1 Tax=Sorangium sp. So ce128 TaxID=3133281 RepID=UPI003F622175